MIWTDLEDFRLSEISHIEKRQIPYDFTNMQNLRNKRTKPKKNRLADTEDNLETARGEEGWGLGGRSATQ